MSFTVFVDMMPCSVVDILKCFGETYSNPLQGKETVLHPEMET
jgi:hypothetical protein